MESRLGSGSGDGLGRLMVKASVFVLALNMLSKVLNYLFNIVAVRSLTVESYGVLSLSWAVVSFSVAILLLGVPASVSRFISFHRGEGDSKRVLGVLATGLGLTFGLVVFGVFVLYAGASLFPGFLSLSASQLHILLVLFCANSFFMLAYHLFIGFRRPQVSSLLDSLASILKFLLLLVFVYLGLTLSGALGALAIAFLLATVVGLLYFVREFDWGIEFSPSVGKKILFFGLPLTITSVSYTLLTWSDSFMIRYFSGFSSVGLYRVADMTSVIGLILYSSLIMIYSPVITELFGHRDYEKIQEISSYLLESLVVLFMPFLIFVWVFSEQIISVMFTSDYVAASTALRILSVSVFFSGPRMVFSKILQAFGKPVLEAKAVAFGTIANIVLNLFLIRWFGISGAAFSTLIAIFLIALVSLFYVRGVTKISISGGRVVRIVVACVVSLLVLVLIKTIVQNSLASIVLGGFSLVGVYILCVLVFRALRGNDVIIVDMVLEKLGVSPRFRRSVSMLLSKAVLD